MRIEVRMAALRAAAKLAFATTVLVGCSSADETAGDTEDQAADLQERVAQTDAGAAADATDAKADARPFLPCCEWAPEGLQCTWTGRACTPWGPPVPPRMPAGRAA